MPKSGANVRSLAGPTSAGVGQEWLLRVESRRSSDDVAGCRLRARLGYKREVLELAGVELRSERVLVMTDLAADLPMISASKGQLQEVILNLVTNAVDAMRPITDRARVLEVSSAFASGQGVLIDVADAGTGIEP